MKKLKITIEGKAYDVEVEVLGEENSGAPIPTRAASVSAAAPAAPAPAAATAPVAAAGPGSVVSPLAATIVSIDVQAGQQVAAGDKLLTLEAMKMNTIVSAPKAGTVSEILVQAAQSVEEGQALINLS